MPASINLPEPSHSPESHLAIPIPTRMGILFFVAAIAALTLGILRKELVTLLWGTILLATEVYALVATIVTSIIQKSSIIEISCELAPRETNVGETCDAKLYAGKTFCPPAILVRYKIELHTFDRRRIEIELDPKRMSTATFAAKYRGSYYAENDRLLIFDFFGFFIASYSIQTESVPRLLVRPAPAEENLISINSPGGSEVRTEQTFRRTNDLTESRRYTPGDDPRRINWKLFSHSGELFVREGEAEPPPRSRFVVLLDSSVDQSVFDLEAGRLAVDTLAEQALGLVNSLYTSGYEPLFGYNGGKLLSGGPQEAAAAFAAPAAVSLNAAPKLPTLDEDQRGVVILALPRSSIGSSAIDQFLKNVGKERHTEIIFVLPHFSPPKTRPMYRKILFRSFYGPERRKKKRVLFNPEALDRTTASCVAAYAARGGVRARQLQT